MEELVRIIVKLFGNEEEVLECFRKSTIFICEIDGIIIGNNEFIYYIVVRGTLANRLKFLSKHYDLLRGKIAYTKNEKVVEAFGSERLGISPDGSITFRIKDDR